MGGLGNQLFQIFTTIAYGIKTNRKVVFTFSDILTTGVHRPTYWYNIFSSLKPFTVLNSENNISNEEIDSFPKYREPHHHYREIPLFNQGRVSLFGYYQSYKYFVEEKDKLLSLMDIETQQEYIRDKYNYYFDKQFETTSMHFRLGDYKHKQDCHLVLPYEYYENALFNIMLYRQSNKQYKILYFCENEDNDIVNEHIERLKERYENIVFMKVNDSIPDWEQLLMMSCCDNNIIANSSFSWWGGYLNRSPYKFVCYPHVWFGPTLKSNIIDDMFPITWNNIKW